MSKNIISIIPARGGSKGVPRKNIKLLAGKPLIAYSIEVAKNSKYINRVLVSTEDEEIKNVAKQWGAEVIDRPKELAQDKTPTIDVILHTLEYLKKEEGMNPDLVVLLQPTSPLRTVTDVDESINLFLSSSDALSLVSITEYDTAPFYAVTLSNGYLKPLFDKKYFQLRRQDVPKAYKPNGAIFIASPQTLTMYKTFYTPMTIGYIMPKERSIDIDTEFDFALAEFILEKQQRNKD